jgi:hypothetical protein
MMVVVLKKTDVVPYNLELTPKYDCHINIKVCIFVQAIRYIYKYIYKGHDKAIINNGEEQHEIKKYLDA